MIELSTLVRLAAATAAGLYAAWLLLQRFRGGAGNAAPVNDLRLVLDLAARLRDAGKTDAVKLCQQLIDELLKPQEKKT